MVAKTVLLLLLFLNTLKNRSKHNAFATISLFITRWGTLCNILPCCLSRIRRKSPCTETQDHAPGPSHSAHKAQAKSRISKRKADNQKKAKKIKREPNDDDDDGPSDPQPSDDEIGTPGGDLMACHFYKFDPIKHHVCATKTLRGFSRVKQHLKRDHGLGELHCSSCWTVFTRVDLYERHTNTSCERVDFALTPQRLFVHEMNQLEHVPAQVPVRDKWYWVWNKFFAGHEAPASPFIQADITKFEEPIRRLAQHGRRRAQSCLLRYNVRMDSVQTSRFIDDFLRTIMSTPQADLPIRDRHNPPTVPCPSTRGPGFDITTQNQQPPDLRPATLAQFPQCMNTAESRPFIPSDWKRPVLNVALPQAAEQVDDGLGAFSEACGIEMATSENNLPAVDSIFQFGDLELLSLIDNEGEHPIDENMAHLLHHGRMF